MSSLGEVIKQYCPNGVPYAKVGDIIEYRQGGTLTRHQVLQEGKYPVMNGGVSYSGYYSESNCDESCLTISHWGSYAGHVHRHYGKFWANNACWAFAPKSNKICLLLYLYFTLKNKEKYIMEKYAFGGATPNLNRQMFENMAIPLPPLPVQQEIVRVLDSFSELQANLQQELDVRKKQFKAYQELFMTEIDESYEKKSLGELFSFKNGLNKGKEFFGEGTPIIMFSNVFNHRALYNEAITSRVTITEKELARIDAKRGDVFFTRTSETQEDVGMSSVLLDDIKSCTFSGFLIRARPHTDLLLPDYCRFCFGSSVVRASIVSNSIYTTRASLTGAGLSKVFISIPPREVQQKIVSILNSFEQLVQNIKEEIIVRQKQYEYYREKLLTFNTI